MAAEILVTGPSVVEWSLPTSSPTWNILGYSDNDTLPSIQFTDHMHEVRTVLSGQNPEEIVLQGTSCRISLALVKTDMDELDAMFTRQRGSGATPNAATTKVGKRLVGNDLTAPAALFRLRIRSVDLNSTAYEFGRCYFPNDSYGDSQWGNRERVITLSINAIPNDVGLLYTYTPPEVDPPPEP